MVKTFRYLVTQASLKAKLNHSQFLFYVEKQDAQDYYHHYEYVYILAKDRLFRLHVQYGEFRFKRNTPDYEVMDGLTRKNYLYYQKVLKHGKPTSKHHNVLSHIMQREKELSKNCHIHPFIPLEIF